jgi:hypothetical protein
MRIHTSDKLYEWDVCEKAMFRQHYKDAHEDTYVQTGELKRIWTHNGEKQCTCYIHMREFTQTADFKMHVRIHTTM